MPILIVGGRFDRISMPRYDIEYKKYAPKARFVIMEQSGHFPFVEQPEQTLALLREFLSTNNSPVTYEPSENPTVGSLCSAALQGGIFRSSRTEDAGLKPGATQAAYMWDRSRPNRSARFTLVPEKNFEHTLVPWRFLWMLDAVY